MTDSKMCLICLSKIEVVEREVNSDLDFNSGVDKNYNCVNLTKELDVIFILRNILNVPSSLCEDFLTKLGNPSDWEIVLCRLCQLVVRESQFIFARIKTLAKEYEDLKLNLKGRFVVDKQEANKSRTSKKYKSPQDEDVSSIIRRHLQQSPVKQKKSFPASTSTISGSKKRKGDKTLAEIKKPKRNVVQKEEEIIISEVQSLEGISTNFVEIKIEPSIYTEEEENQEDSFFPIKEDAQEEEVENELKHLISRRSLRDKKNKKQYDDEESDLDQVLPKKDEEEQELDDWNPEGSGYSDGDSDYETSRQGVISKKDKRTFNDGEEQSSASTLKKWLHPCQYCPSSLKNSLAVETHILRVHKGVKRPYTCDMCPKTFNKLFSVLYHIDKQHYLDIKISEPIVITKEELPDENINNELNPEGFLHEKLFLSIFEEIEVSPEEPEQEKNDDETLNQQESENDNLKPLVIRRYKKKEEDGEINPLTCEHCSFTFSAPFILQAHILRCHYGDKQPFQCDYCPRRFIRKVMVMKHRVIAHPKCSTYTSAQTSLEDRIEELKKKTIVRRRPYTNVEITTKAYRCRICETTYKNRVIAEIHLKRAHEGLEPKESCFCGFHFLTEMGLKVHTTEIHIKGETTNTNPRQSHSCEDCDITFRTQDRLWQHQRKVHNSNSRRVLCQFCGSPFSDKANLACHQRQVHSKELGINPINCKQCGRNLWSKRNLRLHMIVTHTKQYPFKCSQCESGFGLKSQLNRHVSVVHRNERNFKCTEKGCGKSFSQSGNFNTHMRTHTGEKPYKCNFKDCQKEYSDKPTFNRHVQTHGTKVHICPTCHKQFKVWHAFRLHCKKHDGILPKRNIKLAKSGRNTYRDNDDSEEEDSNPSTSSHNDAEVGV